MKAKRELGSQLSLLLTGVAANGIAHLEEMKNDLIQTNLLLEEAIAKLNGSFFELHDALNAQMEAAGRIASNADSAQEHRERLNRLAEEVGGHVDSVVTGLQFQDMTSQLIGRALHRIEGLRLMLGAFASAGSSLMQQDACEDMAGVLERTSERLALQSKELNGQLEKTVRQQHMEGGSIDLF